MKTIQFAEGLTLHLDAVTQTIGLIARKRAGKTYAATKLLEGLADAGAQFVACDPVGVYWGLRVAADGKGAGLDVVILGGLRGDIPLDPHSGALVADAVMDSGRNFVLDVSQFSLGQRKRFMFEFGERIWARAKAELSPRPIHIVLEECQLFLPQQPQPDERPMLGIWTEIVRLGGNKGLGVTMVTQRPQSVAKEALTQVECLVVLQVTGVPEKKALKEWIIEKDADTDLLNELPFLQRGVAYIWSPQWLEHFGKHRILPKRTFDASATPKLGEKRVQVSVKPLDLDALKSQMAETLKKMEESDPRALKKRIAELEQRLAKRPEAPAPKPVEVQVFTPAQIDAVTDLTDSVRQFGTKCEGMVRELYGVLDKMRASPGRAASFSSSASFARSIVARPAAHAGEGLEGLGKGELAMLEALALRHPRALSREQVGGLSGYSANSGTFANYLSKLRARGLVTDGFPLRLTDAGAAATASLVASAPKSEQEVIDLWRSKLEKGPRALFDVLLEVRPGSLTRDELGERSGYSSNSGTFANYLARVRSLSLVENDGRDLRVSRALFEEGGR